VDGNSTAGGITRSGDKHVSDQAQWNVYAIRDGKIEVVRTEQGRDLDAFWQTVED
jgi:hypothetical protein